MPGRRLDHARRRCNRASSQPSESECRHQTPRSRKPGRRSPNQAGLEASGLALGEYLGGHAASQNKQSEHARRQHEEEQLIEEGAELQAAQRQTKRVDAQVQDVKDVEQCGDGCWHCDLEDALDPCSDLCNAREKGISTEGAE
eukprot:scaffold7010_cov68-Phaeocystis_antarctica.AAC.1